MLYNVRPDNPIRSKKRRPNSRGGSSILGNRIVTWTLCIILIIMDSWISLVFVEAYVGEWIVSHFSYNHYYHHPRRIRRRQQCCTFVVVSARTTTTEQQQQEPQNTAILAFQNDMRRVLQQRKQQSLQQPSASIIVDTTTVSSDSLSRPQTPAMIFDDADGAERVLDMLEYLEPFQKVNEESYRIVMEAFVLRGRLRWKKRKRSNNYNNNNDDNSLLLSSSSSTTDRSTATILCAADQVEELFQRLLRDKHPEDVPVSLQTIRLVLQAYANCATPRGQRNYAQKAQALLERLEKRRQEQSPPRKLLVEKEDEDENDLPLEIYLHVLHAHAWQQANRASAQSGAQAADDILEHMLWKQGDNKQNNRNNNNPSNHVIPTAIIQGFVFVIEAWSKCIDGAQKCQERFDQLRSLLHRVENESDWKRLDADVYTNVILAWSKITNSPNATEKAYTLWKELIRKYRENTINEPPLIAFNSVITALARMGDIQRAQTVLDVLEELSCASTNLVPNAMPYNSILHGILHNFGEKALPKASEIVQYMEEQKQTRPTVAPNCFSYSMLLKCYLQSSENNPEHADQAMACLDRIETLWKTKSQDTSLVPTNRLYNMVMNGFAKSYHRNAGERAMELLDRMKRIASSELPAPSNQRSVASCRPDIISYTCAIECWSVSASSSLAPAQAEVLLNEAQRVFEQTGDKSLMPNLRTYTMAIQCFAKHNGSVVKARALLTRLQEQYEKTKDPQLYPNSTYPYNYVLNCAANTLMDDKLEAFRVATQTYQDLRQSKIVSPDEYTFAFWLKCCQNLLDPNLDIRNQCIQYAFEECKQQGLVTNEVLTRLFQCSPPTLVQSVLEIEDRKITNKQRRNQIVNYRSLTSQDLPLSWSRNVRRK